MKDVTRRPDHEPDLIDEEIKSLMRRIKEECVPERLLELARKLQTLMDERDKA